MLSPISWPNMNFTSKIDVKIPFSGQKVHLIGTERYLAGTDLYLIGTGPYLAGTDLYFEF